MRETTSTDAAVTESKTPGVGLFNWFSPKKSEAEKKALLLNQLLTASLNADELNTIHKIVGIKPEHRAYLLSTKETANIKHLERLGIQHKGTPLQMALYSGDEDVVAYLRTMMDPIDFKNQLIEVFANTLPLKETGFSAKNATELNYYDKMLEVQKVEAKKLCDDAFFDETNDRFSVTNETIVCFQERLTAYVKENAMHNPYILLHLYKIYDILISDNNCIRDSLFAQKAIGFAHALSSARWLQHYAQGIYHLALDENIDINEWKRESVKRSFNCRPDPHHDVRDFIPHHQDVNSKNHLGVNSFMHILGFPGHSPGLPHVRVYETFINLKRDSFRTLLSCEPELVLEGLSASA